MLLITDHAGKRCVGRAIPAQVVDWLVAFGKEVRSHGCSKYYLDKSAREKIEKEIGKDLVRRYQRKLNAMAVVADSGVLVTAAYRTCRIKK